LDVCAPAENEQEWFSGDNVGIEHARFDSPRALPGPQTVSLIPGSVRPAFVSCHV
jgi:hypothetical protein